MSTTELKLCEVDWALPGGGGPLVGLLAAAELQ